MRIHPLYLNGEFVTTDMLFPVRNPANGQTLAHMSAVDQPRLAQAIADAQAAFPAWRALTAKARGEYLHKIANELQRRRDEITRTMTLENGKPLAQSAGEFDMSLDHLHWFAEEARRGYGRIIPHQTDGKRNLVIKSPVGVVAAISPWNFPLVLGVRKVAAALAAGCPVLLKPASATPLCNVAFAEAVHAVKLPAGVFQLVACPASEIAREFLQNPLVRKISFTGSTEVGRAPDRRRRGPRQTRSPSNWAASTPSSSLTTLIWIRPSRARILAKFRNTGQSCIAANRIYAQRPIYDRFLQRLAVKAAALKVGRRLRAGRANRAFDRRKRRQKSGRARRRRPPARRPPAVRRQTPGPPRLFLRPHRSGRRAAATAFVSGRKPSPRSRPSRPSKRRPTLLPPPIPPRSAWPPTSSRAIEAGPSA